jgi:branched-chain amino acid transport system ATP-binding protein
MTADASPILQVNGLAKAFGGTQAVNAVSFGLSGGEILGVVGPNGAGKTTLINMVSGLIKPDRGDVRFRGAAIHALPPYAIARLGIARTFQIVRPLRELSVIENVMVGALFGRRACRSTSEARAIAKAALERVRLDGRADAECRTISTGETKRLDLARAIAMEPSILLLDEPLAGVGERETQSLVELIVGLARDGTAIFLVEHVMRVVWTIADRVVVLHHGEKIAEGPPAAVAEDEKVIAAYLGSRFTRQDPRAAQAPADASAE